MHMVKNLPQGRIKKNVCWCTTIILIVLVVFAQSYELDGYQRMDRASNLQIAILKQNVASYGLYILFKPFGPFESYDNENLRWLILWEQLSMYLEITEICDFKMVARKECCMNLEEMFDHHLKNPKSKLLN